jgi:hypothetical protein
MSDEPKHDVDLELPEPGIGSMKKIVRLPGMQRIAPKIRWGDIYLGKVMDPEKERFWTDKDRLKYAEALASTMNHAADELQKERNRLLERVQDLKNQVNHAAEMYEKQGQLMTSQVNATNAEKQELYERITKLKGGAKKMIRERDARIRELEAQLGSHDRQADEDN